MIIARIEGATRTCGKSQGFMGLPVRDEAITMEDGTPAFLLHTAWESTPEEIEMISKGAKIIVSIMHFNPTPAPHPMIVNVGKIGE